MIETKPKRSHHKKKPTFNGEKPKLGHPDPLASAQEVARLAQEGNRKLSVAVDTLRQTLETIASAEMDNSTNLPVSARDLRQLAVAGLDAYSHAVGQSWRRHKIVESRAGDRDLRTLEQ